MLSVVFLCFSYSNLPVVLFMFLVSNNANQKLKDVSTTWQVRTNELLFFHCLATWQMCPCVFLIAVVLCCRTGDISWLIDKGAQWFHLGKSQQVHRTRQHGHLWCWDTEQLTWTGDRICVNTEDNTETCFCSRKKQSYMVWIHWITGHVSNSNIGFSVCAAAKFNYLYTLFIRSQETAFLYK